MPKMSGWDKVRLYGGAIASGSSSFVTGSCIGLLGASLMKNPILKVIWYIGGVSIGVVVGEKVEESFEQTVNTAEEVVTYFKEVRKTVKSAEKD